jgi:hypothetical protein
MTETEQNLLTAVQNCVAIAEPVYRIYYDAQGLCTRSDVELFDEPYIEVDKETFNTVTPCLYCVVDNKLQLRKQEHKHRLILIPAVEGPYKTIKGAAMLLVDDSYTKEVQHWKLNDS